jgi:hypothetical protein
MSAMTSRVGKVVAIGPLRGREDHAPALPVPRIVATDGAIRMGGERLGAVEAG